MITEDNGAIMAECEESVDIQGGWPHWDALDNITWQRGKPGETDAA